MALDKLKDYEEMGFSPDEIRAIIELMDEKMPTKIRRFLNVGGVADGDDKKTFGAVSK